MQPSPPEIGATESETLELQSADALRDLRSIAREVVAMLNGRGGDIWIGIAEEDGRAARLEEIPTLNSNARRVEDALIDLIEPPPPHGEVSVERVATSGEDAGLLRVHVARGAHGPYAFLQGVMRGFVTRVGSQVRLMTRDEVRARFSPGVENVPERQEQLRSRVWQELTNADHPGLLVSIEPETPLELDLDQHRQRLEMLLRDPTLTRNRAEGWNFASDYELKPTGRSWRTSGSGRTDSVEILRTGGLRYACPIERLYWQGGPKEIWPTALLEYPTSIVRLARAILELYEPGLADETMFAVGMALTQIRDWTLRPRSPHSLSYNRQEPHKANEDSIIPEPIIVSWRDLREAPDRCAFRLLRLVYESFGYFEDEMPPEFDRATGALRLPS